MIKVKITEEDKKVKEVIFKGHALYDEYGKDIVCASVSSIVITTINAIIRIDDKAISYNENPLIIRVLKDDTIVYKLIDNMLSLLRELEHDYPDNIRFL